MKKTSRRPFILIIAISALLLLVVIGVATTAFAFGRISSTLSGERALVIDINRKESIDYSSGKGVLIQHVEPGSPADLAGIKSGDHVVDVDGLPVNSPIELKNAINKYVAGDSIELTLLSGDEEGVRFLRMESPFKLNL